MASGERVHQMASNEDMVRDDVSKILDHALAASGYVRLGNWAGAAEAVSNISIELIGLKNRIDGLRAGKEKAA